MENLNILINYATKISFKNQNIKKKSFKNQNKLLYKKSKNCNKKSEFKKSKLINKKSEYSKNTKIRSELIENNIYINYKLDSLMNTKKEGVIWQ